MSEENNWPNGYRHAMTQSEHEQWNSDNYPGTREICCVCDDPTGNCEEDNILDDEGEPYCYHCAIGAGLIKGDT